MSVLLSPLSVFICSGPRKRAYLSAQVSGETPAPRLVEPTLWAVPRRAPWGMETPCILRAHDTRLSGENQSVLRVRPSSLTSPSALTLLPASRGVSGRTVLCLLGWAVRLGSEPNAQHGFPAFS